MSNKPKKVSKSNSFFWEPKTPAQTTLKNRLQGYERDVIALGVPGSGKTLVSVNCALDALDSGKISKIVMARPAEGTCKGLGFEPGALDDKLANWVIPMYEVVENRYGRVDAKAMIDSGVIEFLALHQVTGRSFNNCWVLVDEAQGVNIATMNSLITRMGKYSKLVLMGDQRQVLLTRDSGVAYLLELCDKYDMAFDIIEFTLDDCVRSEKVKQRIQCLMDEGIY